jgi:hypothetical protein
MLQFSLSPNQSAVISLPLAFFLSKIVICISVNVRRHYVGSVLGCPYALDWPSIVLFPLM